MVEDTTAGGATTSCTVSEFITMLTARSTKGSSIRIRKRDMAIISGGTIANMRDGSLKADSMGLEFTMTLRGAR